MSAWAPLQARWRKVSPREQRAVLAGAAVLLLAALWWLGVAPALNTLRGAEQQHRLLDAQLQAMQTMQAQARALQAQPRVAPEEVRRQLEAAAKPLAPSLQLSLAGDRATITARLVIGGRPVGPAGQEVMQQINRLEEPFVFTWERKSFLPGSWRLVRVDNAALPGDLHGYEPGDFRRAMRGE